MIHLDTCYLFAFIQYLLIFLVSAYILVFTRFFGSVHIVQESVSLCRMMWFFLPRQEALRTDALTLFECLYCVKEHLIIFTFLQTCIWTKGRKWWSTLMIIAINDLRSKCEDAGIPSADFTKCLWAWQSSVVESMISPYVLSCLLWISSSVLVNLSLMFGSVMDVMIFGYQAAIVNKKETMHVNAK